MFNLETLEENFFESERWRLSLRRTFSWTEIGKNSLGDPVTAAMILRFPVSFVLKSITLVEKKILGDFVVVNVNKPCYIGMVQKDFTSSFDVSIKEKIDRV